MSYSAWIYMLYAGYLPRLGVQTDNRLQRFLATAPIGQSFVGYFPALSINA